MTVDRDWYASGRSILERIGIGDFVEFLGDTRFFHSRERRLERYAGYVTSISNSVIGISTMHPDNDSRFPADAKVKAQKVMEIELHTIGHYRIIRKNDEPIDTNNTPRS